MAGGEADGAGLADLAQPVDHAAEDEAPRAAVVVDERGEGRRGVGGQPRVVDPDLVGVVLAGGVVARPGEGSDQAAVVVVALHAADGPSHTALLELAEEGQRVLALVDDHRVRSAHQLVDRQRRGLGLGEAPQRAELAAGQPAHPPQALALLMAS